MAYTPINWDEATPINPDNLNKMDAQISDITDGTDAVGLAEALTSGLSNVQWASGRYTGGGGPVDTVISVDFTPDIVLIVEKDGYWGIGTTSAIITENHSVESDSGANIASIAENGFRIEDSKLYSDGFKYQWIAIKISN